MGANPRLSQHTYPQPQSGLNIVADRSTTSWLLFCFSYFRGLNTHGYLDIATSWLMNQIKNTTQFVLATTIDSNKSKSCNVKKCIFVRLIREQRSEGFRVVRKRRRFECSGPEHSNLFFQNKIFTSK